MEEGGGYCRLYIQETIKQLINCKTAFLSNDICGEWKSILHMSTNSGKKISGHNCIKEMCTAI